MLWRTKKVTHSHERIEGWQPAAEYRKKMQREAMERKAKKSAKKK
jgi:hypothetical protein